MAFVMLALAGAGSGLGQTAAKLGTPRHKRAPQCGYDAVNDPCSDKQLETLETNGCNKDRNGVCRVKVECLERMVAEKGTGKDHDLLQLDAVRKERLVFFTDKEEDPFKFRPAFLREINCSTEKPVEGSKRCAFAKCWDDAGEFVKEHDTGPAKVQDKEHVCFKIELRRKSADRCLVDPHLQVNSGKSSSN